LMNVFGHIEFGEKRRRARGAAGESPGPSAPHDVVTPVPETVEAPIVPARCARIVAGLTPKSSGEAYNDAGGEEGAGADDVQAGHPSGLEERAAVEALFWRLCPAAGGDQQEAQAGFPARPGGSTIAWPTQYMAKLLALPERARSTGPSTSSFPIAPLHRHTEQPTRRLDHRGHHPATRTGRSTAFIEGETVDETIALHPPAERASRTTWGCS